MNSLNFLPYSLIGHLRLYINRMLKNINNIEKNYTPSMLCVDINIYCIFTIFFGHFKGIVSLTTNQMMIVGRIQCAIICQLIHIFVKETKRKQVGQLIIYFYHLFIYLFNRNVLLQVLVTCGKFLVENLKPIFWRGNM